MYACRVGVVDQFELYGGALWIRGPTSKIALTDFMPARELYVAASVDPTTASMKTDATTIDTMILNLLAYNYTSWVFNK